MSKVFDEFGHELTGTLSPIRVALQDDDGFPVLDENGLAMTTTFRLPDHRWRIPGNERDPEVTLPNGEVRASRWESDPRGEVHSEFDPAGLVLVMCEHGLPADQHPNGREPYPHYGRTWVRAKYATTRYLCVVDDGAPVPPDLTAVRA